MISGSIMQYGAHCRYTALQMHKLESIILFLNNDLFGDLCFLLSLHAVCCSVLSQLEVS